MSEKVIKAYKGFGKNMQCRGFQYEIGKEYDIEGEIELCGRGFHSCKSPIEVWKFYDLIDGDNHFAEVELSGKIIEDKSSTKVCSSHIKIKNELSLTDMINIGNRYLKDTASSAKIKTNKVDVSKINEFNTGDELTKFSSDEDDIIIRASGSNVLISSDGIYTKVISDGYNNQICANGKGSKIISDGGEGAIISTGDYSRINTSSYLNDIVSTGKNADIISNGDLCHIVSTGDYSHIMATGYHTCIDSEGYKCRIIGEGLHNKIKAKKGSWITLVEWGLLDDDGHSTIENVRTEYVDGINIKEDTWYEIKNGEFVETQPYHFKH